MDKTTCIKCGLPCDHSICESCADELIDLYDPVSLVALARLGLDVASDQKQGIIRPKGYLKERYEQYLNIYNGNKE